ncbi:MAG: hypothetical protein HY684_03305 [Chloroflexi bacterium]|nr:hypothetical protein [Chloroflexota bacterium]
MLNQVLRREITGEAGATLIGVSLRHTRRLLAAYRREGAAALAHGNRGRVLAHAFLPTSRRAWAREYFGEYAGYAQQYLFHRRRKGQKA